MGEVWRAEDAMTGRVVALKLLLPQFTDDVEFQRRFLQEARAAAALTEPHVVPIHSFGEIEGRLFVDMRLIEGRDLASILHSGPLDPTRAVWIVEQVASALKAAHQIGLVHRDVKPSNILVTEDDFAYLIDFGIARSVGGTRLTSTGSVMGTWSYMAPERFDDAESDPRSDVYALACVLHECLTGAKPYPGTSLESQFAGHRMSAPPRPSTVRAGVSAAFDEVVARGMAKDPDRRYQTATDLAQAARVACESPAAAATVRRQTAGPEDWQQPTQLAPRPATAGHRRTVLVAVGAVLMTAVVAAAAFLAVRAGTEGGAAAPDPAQTTAMSTVPGAAHESPQTVLPFGMIKDPRNIAVDPVGGVFLVTHEPDRILKLTAGATTPTELSFPEMGNPNGIAVDPAGNVYVADTDNNRVVKLSTTSNVQTVLPFSDLSGPSGVAVDAAGSVYVTDLFNGRVLQLPAGSTTQTVLPFTGLYRPSCIAADSAGSVYVTDWNLNDQVLMLEAGAVRQTVLPFTGLGDVGCPAVDAAGNVYVADMDGSRVAKLESGTNVQSDVPFTGLQKPFAVAVDNTGAVYVTDMGTFRVLRFAP
jgi:serine/threonine-protein kinase